MPPQDDLLTGQNILHTKQFGPQELDLLIHLGLSFEDKLRSDKQLSLLEGEILASLFFEPSTRTRLSFEAAMYRLGGDVVGIADPKTSSTTKGESLKDSIRTVQGYADIIVLRHPEVGSAEKAAKVANIPVINGGDGAGQHPTQALLDIYTIQKEEGTIDGLTISLVGDLKNGRTVHSLGYLLAQYEVKLNLIAPKKLSLPAGIVSDWREMGAEVREFESMEDPLAQTDIVYMTRIQRERFEKREEYEKLKGVYVFDENKLQAAKEGITILHPLPRVDEIPEEIDEYEGAAYFRQSANGVPVRMALISSLLGKVKKSDGWA